jgi:hypothetical protein
MESTTEAGDAGRRSMLAGSLSVALHGGLVVLAVVLFGGRRVAPRAPRLVSIDIVSPPVGPTQVTAPATGILRAGTRSTSVRTAPPLARTQAPTTVDRRADRAARVQPQQVQQPAPEPEPTPAPPTALTEDHAGAGEAATGTGEGAGHGSNGTGPGLEQPMAPPSKARDPRARGAYHHVVPGAERYPNRAIVVELHIDERGRVGTVKMVSGLEPELDARAVAIAYTLEFDPALNDAGEPIALDYRWTFSISNRVRAAGS